MAARTVQRGHPDMVGGRRHYGHGRGAVHCRVCSAVALSAGTQSSACTVRVGVNVSQGGHRRVVDRGSGMAARTVGTAWNMVGGLHAGLPDVEAAVAVGAISVGHGRMARIVVGIGAGASGIRASLESSKGRRAYWRVGRDSNTHPQHALLVAICTAAGDPRVHHGGGRGRGHESAARCCMGCIARHLRRWEAAKVAGLTVGGRRQMAGARSRCRRRHYNNRADTLECSCGNGLPMAFSAARSHATVAESRVGKGRSSAERYGRNAGR